MQPLPDIGQLIVVEINRSLVDATVLSYSKGKKTLSPSSPEDADSVRLALKGLPVGNRTIETETTIAVKYPKEIMKQKTDDDAQQDRETESANDASK